MTHASTAPQMSRRSVNDEIPAFQAHHSRAELAAIGKALRDKCPRASHAEWKPPKDRPDPVQLLEHSDVGRIPELVPLRHGRMLQSPFTFYRGAALNMAVDLAAMPTTKIRVQCCGDAHLVNFRGFGTPERRVQFDIHDLDETLPAPWEWDVKRLAASLVIACRDNDLGDTVGADAALACTRSYREHMLEYGKMRALNVWYDSLDVERLLATIRDDEAHRRAKKRLQKERERSALELDFPELAHRVGEKPMIKDNPPTIYHSHGLSRDEKEFHESLQETFAQYRNSLRPSVRVLLDRFELKDAALKVVGVGSVGTACWVLLLMADKDPLFLQVKEARASVLEAYAGKSVFVNHGERCVNGHQVMQSASDIFLGWCSSKAGRHFYVRQLRDVKLKPKVELFNSTHMIQFGELCGWTLARAHARSGEPAMIAGYLGNSDTFDKAIAAFSIAYADQNERDYEFLRKAAKNGELEVILERE